MRHSLRQGARAIPWFCDADPDVCLYSRSNRNPPPVSQFCDTVGDDSADFRTGTNWPNRTSGHSLGCFYGNRPNTATPFGVPTKTFPFTIVGTMNLLP